MQTFLCGVDLGLSCGYPEFGGITYFHEGKKGGLYVVPISFSTGYISSTCVIHISTSMFLHHIYPDHLRRNCKTVKLLPGVHEEGENQKSAICIMSTTTELDMLIRIDMQS